MVLVQRHYHGRVTQQLFADWPTALRRTRMAEASCVKVSEPWGLGAMRKRIIVRLFFKHGKVY